MSDDPRIPARGRTRLDSYVDQDASARLAKALRTSLSSSSTRSPSTIDRAASMCSWASSRRLSRRRRSAHVA